MILLRAHRRRQMHRGFTLVELMAVIVCVSLLLSILVPSVSAARQAAYRVISASNQRTLGQGVVMFAGGRKGRIPPSRVLKEQPLDLAELMRVYQPMMPDDRDAIFGGMGKKVQQLPTPGDRYREFWAIDSAHFGWDGLGHLYYGNFVGLPGVFYSPSHNGEHTLERYEDHWVHPESGYMPPDFTIYSNFHYIGHKNADGTDILLEHDSSRVIVTDGLRSRGDLNHSGGMNVLLADGSVHWRTSNALEDVLPPDSRDGSDEDQEDRERERQNELIRAVFDGYLNEEIKRQRPNLGL